ncbi:MAG: radical SAM protein [Deltaproteobacteria bacterium]|nr:radical SAM protein [Deltaproteobacteria bacterium]
MNATPKVQSPNPAYAHLEAKGEFGQRVEEAYAIFERCELCPRQCGVNRLEGEKGFCRAPAQVMVYAAQPHFGEEKSLVGKGGSGTIFFSNCNLRCVFCQNWPIAHKGHGRGFPDEKLAQMMLRLQKIGCHNINLVTPTHVMPNILKATRIAYQSGLHIPLVYNTSGYERAEIIKLLDGIVDIYLPDIKFMDAGHAAKYSGGASDYPEIAKAAILEMYRQVGLHQVDDRGVATRGVMIRHLVMPNRVAGTEKSVKWMAESLPKSTYVNIMAQYHPEFEAFDYPKIWRRINVPEFLEAMQWALDAGLTNLDPDSVRLMAFYLNATKKSRH